MFYTNISVDNSALKVITDLEDKLNSVKLNERIGVYLLAKTRDRFDRSVDINNIPFAPIKTRKNGSNVPIVDTGELKNSINYTVNLNEVEIGTPLFYASIHNEGDGVTQRQFLPIDQLPDEYENEIKSVILKYLTET